MADVVQQHIPEPPSAKSPSMVEEKASVEKGRPTNVLSVNSCLSRSLPNEMLIDFSKLKACTDDNKCD